MHSVKIRRSPEAMVNTRVEALATQFEDVTRDLIATVEECSPADWAKLPGGESDPVGVVAHHIAVDLDLTCQFAQSVAFGTPPPAETWAQIDQANAQHSVEYANVSKAAVLDLLQASLMPTANAIRRLQDTQLEKSGIVLGKPMTVQNVVEEFVIGHVRMHLPGIQAALTP